MSFRVAAYLALHFLALRFHLHDVPFALQDLRLSDAHSSLERHASRLHRQELLRFLHRLLLSDAQSALGWHAFFFHSHLAGGHRRFASCRAQRDAASQRGLQ